MEHSFFSGLLLSCMCTTNQQFSFEQECCTVLLFKTKSFFFSSQKREDFLALTDAQEKSRNRKCLGFLHTTTACAGRVGWCEPGAIWISPLVSWFRQTSNFKSPNTPTLRCTCRFLEGKKKKRGAPCDPRFGV